MFVDTKSEHSTDEDSEAASCHSEKATYHPLHTAGQSKAHSRKLKSFLAQAFVTIAVMLSAASCGMPVGYSAILLPQLRFTNDTMQIDDEMGSWIASIHSAATPFGSLLSGILMDHFGRKLALQIASLPLLIGWALIAFSTNHTILLIGRMTAGLSAGLTAAAGQVLIGETAEPHFRGIFSSVPFASYSFGILLVYALGSVLPWRQVAGLSTILPIVSTTLFFLLPESPMWLIRKGRIDDAKKSLIWLRGDNGTQAKKEIQVLIERIDGEQKSFKINYSESSRKLEVIKPFVILNLFNLFQIFSGTYIVVFYAVDIVSTINGHSVDQFFAAVLTACVRFVFSLVATILLALTTRRTLALISAGGTAGSALALGLFLVLQTSDTNLFTPTGIGPIAAVLVLIYVAANTVGFLILPGVLMAELYPAKVRGLAGGITFMIFNLTLFGVAKIFPMVKNSIGIEGSFLLFGISSLLATVFLWALLPETKGKTLDQIEDYFQQKNLFWITRDKEFHRKIPQGTNGDDAKP